MDDSLKGIKISRDTPLAPLTTMGVGGPTDLLVKVNRINALDEALSIARGLNKPIMVLGGGSNIVFPDQGFRGVILQLAFDNQIVVDESKESVCLQVEAGCHWDSLVSHCVKNGWSGLECLSAIPGSVGAAPMQNIGAYGQEVSELIKSVHCLEIASGKPFVISKEKCEFGYRTSIFKSKDKGRYLITAVELVLSKVKPPRIAYKELDDHLNTVYHDWHRTPLTAQLDLVRKSVVTIRRRKSMVFDPSDPFSRSCGSFFLNPILDQSAIDRIREKAPDRKVPTFQHNEAWKVPAAWLVEQAGFSRGYRKGKIGLSPHHALAIVNHGGTSREILALSRDIQSAVHRKFSVTLVPEPVLVEALEHAWQR